MSPFGYVEIKCFKCGELFCMANDLFTVAKRSGKNFWCPNGHQQHFVLGPTEADKLRQERDRLAQRIAQKDDEIKRQRELREHTERRLAAAKGQVTKIKNRVGAGTCPCCNRTFQQLARHMEHKHPEYRTSETLQ